MFIHKILLVVFLFASSFFTVTHFHFTPANISHFLTTALKFSCFVANEVRLLWFFWVFLFLFLFLAFFNLFFLFCFVLFWFFFISCSSSFSLSHVNVRQKKFSRERGFFLSPGQFTLVTLWCGRNSSTQCIFLLVRSFIDPTFCGIFFCCPLQFKCQIFFPILLPHNVTLPSNAFYGGNVACISVGLFFFLFFFYCRSLSLRWPQEFLIFSPPL